MTEQGRRPEPEEERAARAEGGRGRGRVYRERDTDRLREQRRAYRASHADQIREGKRAWRERNADHIREYRAAYDAAHRDEVLQQKREYMKGYHQRKAQEHRQQDNKKSSAKKYYEAHKEQHHEYTRQWRARKLAENPEGFRTVQVQRQRRWREAHKEEQNAKLRARRRENPEANRVAQRVYYAAHAEQLKAQKRAHYAANRDAVLARNRSWKQREKRRKDAGLPPRRIHTTSAGERRANTVAADEFFSRLRSPEEVAHLRHQLAALEQTPEVLLAALARDNARARLEHALATDFTVARRSRLGEARAALAAQPSRRAERDAEENARLDAIGRQVNDRLRRNPPRRTPHVDPAAPHPMLTPTITNTTGMNR
ncbi:hypothetical protein AB2L57_01030 [Microbacterium sp. HA-8]|uniref:hypothetical protein n=1 Tax=Microbacterium sp. HA-8 TaxID=3234200 RepID=UPI0038F7EA23